MTLITITGDPGSGKSTLAKQLAKLLHVPHFSGGDLFRKAAYEASMSVQEFSKAAEEDPDLWDTKIDSMQAQLQQEHPTFVIDSRLGWHFLPDSIKIFVKCDLHVAAERLQSQDRTGETWKTTEEGAALLRERQESERKRYEQLYNVNHLDLQNYDLIVDSTSITVEDKLQQVVDFLKERGVVPDEHNNFDSLNK